MTWIFKRWRFQLAIHIKPKTINQRAGSVQASDFLLFDCFFVSLWWLAGAETRGPPLTVSFVFVDYRDGYHSTRGQNGLENCDVCSTLCSNGTS